MSWIVFTTVVLAVASGCCPSNDAGAAPEFASDGGQAQIDIVPSGLKGCIAESSSVQNTSSLNMAPVVPWLAAVVELSIACPEATLLFLDIELILRSRTIYSRYSGTSPPV